MALCACEISKKNSDHCEKHCCHMLTSRPDGALPTLPRLTRTPRNTLCSKTDVSNYWNCGKKIPNFSSSNFSNRKSPESFRFSNSTWQKDFFPKKERILIQQYKQDWLPYLVYSTHKKPFTQSFATNHLLPRAMFYRSVNPDPLSSRRPKWPREKCIVVKTPKLLENSPRTLEKLWAKRKSEDDKRSCEC